MTHRHRLVAFGSAFALALAGGLCAATIPGLLGQVLAIALLSLGLGGAVLLVFLEIGLGEDRDRARDEARALERANRLAHAQSPLRLTRRRPRRRRG
jgi:hypothetical protein